MLSVNSAFNLPLCERRVFIFNRYAV